MIKKTNIITISASVIITGIFVWFVLTSSNISESKDANDNKNVTQNTQTSAVPPKPLEGATIIENNKVNNTSSNSSDSSKEINGTDKVSNEATVKGSESTTVKETEKEVVKPTKSEDLSADSKENYTVYEVKQGESLLSICKQFSETSPIKITSKAIIAANKLNSSSEVKAGMKLKIPSKYSSGAKYAVTSGDSLYTIASTYMKDMSIYEAIEKIKKDNFLASDSIKIGDELFLAGVAKIKEQETTISDSSNTATIKEQTSDKDQAAASKYKLYTLKKGENLLSVCKQYEKYCPVSIASKTILKYNNISNKREVKEGITLKIPDKYLINGEKYTVKLGDSLSKIATEHLKNLEMYKGIEKIMKDNYKTTHDIKIGEEIFIASSEL